MNFIIENNEIYLLNESDEKIAYVKFPDVKDGVVNITTTYVSDVLRGQGVAGKLLEFLYNEVKEKKLKVIATCSYAIKWFEKNIDKQDVLWQE